MFVLLYKETLLNINYLDSSLPSVVYSLLKKFEYVFLEDDPSGLLSRPEERDYILGLIDLCTCTCGYTNNFCTNKNHLHIQKNYHWSGVHQNLYTYTESNLLIHVHFLLNIFCSNGIQNIIILLHWSLHLIQTLIHIHI